MKITPARYLVIAISLATWCTPFQVTASWAASNTAQSLTVFNCDGRYVELNTVSGAKLASGLYGGFVESQSRIDGCSIADVLDENQNVLYALLPESPRMDENGEQRFQVAALDAKTLKLLHQYELPQSQAQRPMLFFDPARQDLLVAMNDYGIWQRLAIQSNGALAPSGPAITIKEPFPSSPAPYIDGQGNMIDGLHILDSQGRLVRKIQPDSILDTALQEKFASLTQIKGSPQHYYGTIPGTFAGDRIAFTVGWDREDTRVPSAGVVVYDLRAGRAISSFFSTFPVAPGYAGEHGVPSLHLTPDGRRIILEQYDWRPSSVSPRTGEESRQSRFRTGMIAIYDADTGSLSGTVTMGPAHDDHAVGRVINFSNDSRYLYYWFDKRLYVIDLESDRVASTITLPDGFDPAAVVSGQ
jgi:hypothetical protein